MYKLLSSVSDYSALSEHICYYLIGDLDFINLEQI